MIAEIVGMGLIPALAGAVSGWIYWLAAGRPQPPEEKAPDEAG